MFKEGDYVKLKPKTKLESGFVTNDWAGKITEIYTSENTCLITFDAPTINSFPDEILLEAIDDGAEPYEYIFRFAELELMERRDTEEELSKAFERLNKRMNVFFGEENEEKNESFEAVLAPLQELFQQSTSFLSLTNYQQESTPFILEMFFHYLYNYECKRLDNWTKNDIEEVCLSWIPRKVSAELELFENFGLVLIHFFQFLKENDHTEKIHNIDGLIAFLTQLAPQITQKANNPGNWGMAKSIFGNFGHGGQSVSTGYQQPSLPKADPYKGIGRNEKIRVKYTNGKILENVKFKKVERDLREGSCELA